jgi:DNA-binding SARP family transcriptional activator
VLGPLVVEVDGIERSITSRRQRAVLACLAPHPGRAVSADRLLDEIWPRRPARHWGANGRRPGLQACATSSNPIESVRTLIRTSSAGYALHVEPDRVDVHRFDRLLDEALGATASDPAVCGVDGAD